MDLKYILVSILVIATSFSGFSQDYPHKAKSDSLFAEGVKLYNLKKYDEAIPFFTECDKIDKAELDSTSNRRDYASMWLASCFFHLGDTVKAKDIDKVFYKFPPVDRRLTVQSDSLNGLLPHIDDFNTQITIAKHAYDLAKNIVGETHQYSLGSLINLSLLYCFAEDIDNSYQCFNDIYFNTQSHSNNSYTFNEVSLKIIFSCILNNFEKITDFDDIRELDKMIAISSFSKLEPDGFVWSQLIDLKSKLLLSQNRIDEYYQLVDSVYQDICNINYHSPNKYEIFSLMGTSLYNKTISTSDFLEKADLCKQRREIYDDMLTISESLWGNTSYEYGCAKFKIANLDLGAGLELDRENGRKRLVEAFDIISNSDEILYELDEITELIKNAYISFDVAGATDLYIDYIKKIINKYNSANPDAEIDGLREQLARAQLSGSRDDTIESIQLYTTLIDNNMHNQEKHIDWLEHRAIGYQRIKKYENSLKDYLRIDSLYDSRDFSNAFFLDRSDRNNVKKNISEIFLQLSDTTKSESYWDQYCLNEEKIIEDIVMGKYPNNRLYDKYKFEIIKDYASSFIVFPNGLHSDFNKAIKYANINLNLISSIEIDEASKIEFKLSILDMLSLCYSLNKDFKNGYVAASELLSIARNSNNTHYLHQGLRNLSNLYDWVSVEPELALKYKLSGCELLSEDIVLNRNKLLKEEYIISRDMMYYEWEKCIDLYSYLADEESIDRCYEKLFHYTKLIDGENSDKYAELRLGWYTNYKIPQYFNRNKNNKEIGLAYCDSLANFYLNNSELLKNSYFNSENIARDYDLLGDSLNAEKFLNIRENELRIKYPQNIECQPEFLRFLKERLDILYGYDNVKKLAELKGLEPIFEQSRDINKNEYLDLLTNIAQELKYANDIESEIEYLNKILSIRYDNSIFLQRLVLCYQINNQWNEIVPYFDKLSISAKEYILNEIKDAPSEYRENIWSNYVEIPFNIGEALVEQFPKKISTGTLYDNLLMRKNFLLNSSISAENLIKEEGDSLLLSKYNRLQRLKNFLDSSNDTIVDLNHTINREQAEKLIKRFNKEIMRRAGILGDYTTSLICNWESIQATLKIDEVAIEFSRYQSYDGKVSYAALILTNQGYPIFCPLFKESEFEHLTNDELYTNGLGYNLIWLPINKYINGKKKVYFSPDGILYGHSIENITDNTGLQISNRYNLYRLSSTRELVVNHKKTESNNVTLYGGLNYSADIGVLVEDINKYPTISKYRGLNLSNIADSLNLRSGVSALPATKIEVEYIKGFLDESNISCEIFTANEGTEASFKNLSGKEMGIIHIATHGFYWTEHEARKLSFLNPSNKSNNLEDKPLSRSGLLLTGANNALMGHTIPVNAEDGILTAKEVSTLDLRGLDMIVLSACQSGLGEITGDGVFGLQRGFKKAGANTLLMSLWKVDDRATQMLMTKFYEHFLSGRTKLESLILAQKYVREYEEEVEIENGISNLTASQIRRNKRQNEGSEIPTLEKKKIRPFEDPKYWAAFVLLDALD